jgi:hypothetical protein
LSAFTLAPLRPITTPGLAVTIVTRRRLGKRWISIREMPARPNWR